MVSSSRGAVWMLGALACLAVVLTVDGAAAQITESVWDGVYTEQQAQRGRVAFRRECTECHGDDLRGGETAPGLVGQEFVSFWSETSLGELYAVTQETMPEESPGELGEQTYADILAYMLQVNKFPAGDEELEPDVDRLSKIGISEEKQN